MGDPPKTVDEAVDRLISELPLERQSHNCQYEYIGVTRSV